MMPLKGGRENGSTPAQDAADNARQRSVSSAPRIFAVTYAYWHTLEGTHRVEARNRYHVTASSFGSAEAIALEHMAGGNLAARKGTILSIEELGAVLPLWPER